MTISSTVKQPSSAGGSRAAFGRIVARSLPEHLSRAFGKRRKSALRPAEKMRTKGVKTVGSALCQAMLCKTMEEGPGRAGAAQFLCKRCRDRLVNDLINLPTLYTDCNRAAGTELVRVIRKTPRKSTTGDAMNPAAAEIRSAIRTVLASWAGLVAEERRLERPVRDIPALTRFLARHADWLARHPAAGELVDEIRDLVRTARNIAYPDTVRRVRIGTCPEGDCPGELVALIRPSDDPHPSEIVCTVSPRHTWPVSWWTRLARRYEAAKEK